MVSSSIVIIGRIFFAAWSIFLVSNCLAAEETIKAPDANDTWKLATKSKDLMVYSRLRAGSRLKEFKAVGEIDAPTGAVNGVIDDFENYPKFMPFMAECRLIKRDSDWLVGYQRLSPKVCQDRDYTLRVWKQSWPTPDGVVYLSTWWPANEFGPPETKGVVRVKTCEGAWLLEPESTNKTRATYSIYTDTGGAIPVFIANHISQLGIGRLFTAVRKQVKNPKYAANER